MSDTQNTLSVTALIVALIALIITIGQFVQQLFATAEGSRRCSPSVLGPWAQKTRYKWQWKQFRFEVLFTTPDIVLDINVPATRSVTSSPHTVTMPPKIVALDATGKSATSTATEIVSQSNTQMVGWIDFLRKLESMHNTTLSKISMSDKETTLSPMLVGPAMALREWSWDFMPNDVVRPLATSSVGTIVVLVHRMGMTWRDLRPSQGIMRAEGNGQSFSSTIIRGLGLLGQYTCEERVFVDGFRIGMSLRIPTASADKMSCGIVPGTPELDLPDLSFLSQDNKGMPTLQNAESILNDVGFPPPVAHALSDRQQNYGPLYDLLFMWATFLPIRGSKLVEVFNPLRVRYNGCLGMREGRLVVKARLKEYLSSEENQSKQLLKLSDSLSTFAARHAMAYVNSHRYHAKGNLDTIPQVDHAYDAWMETTAYFKRVQSEEMVPCFAFILAFASIATDCWQEARRRLEDGTHRDDQSIVSGPRASVWIEVCHCYVDHLEHAVDTMTQNGLKDRQLGRDAYWTLLVRGVLFASPLLVLPETEFPAVPSQFYGNRTPVYIA